MLELEEKIAGEIVLSENPGLTLRKWREEFHITQAELSNYLKISPSVISDYEIGRRKSPGISTVKKIVEALISMDISKGSNTIKKFTKNFGSDAIIDIKEFWTSVPCKEVTEYIEGKNLTESINMDKKIYGYTMVNSLKAIIEFNAYDYLKIYGWSNERALIFTGVKFGRSPMVAIRAHPLKPGMVVFARPENVDPLSIKLAELENIPLVITSLDDRTIISRLHQL
ncbi:MAG: helix-turn-helix domain-containing protein [Thermoplasmata archaeon]